MADSFDLRAPEFLGNAHDCFRRTGWQLGNHVEAAREMVSRAMARMEAVGEARLEELRDAQRALDAVDEDEGDSYERSRRDEALEAVHKHHRLAARLEAAGRQFIARSCSLSDRGQQLALAGVASLERRIDATAEYVAICVPDATGGVLKASAAAAAHSFAVTPAGITASLQGDSHGPLPAGFGWINIDEVDPLGFIDDPRQFKKAKYSDMCRGLEILRDEIIPALKLGRFSREDAERIDRELGTDYTAEGWIHPESRLTVWRAFLDSRREADVVTVERGADGKYHVTSGRHRLGLARQIGIKMVPVRVLGHSHGP